MAVKRRTSCKAALAVRPAASEHLVLTLVACCGQDRYKPRQDETGTPGGWGFLHYTANGQYVTVASGKGDPSKARFAYVRRSTSGWHKRKALYVPGSVVTFAHK